MKKLFATPAFIAALAVAFPLTAIPLAGCAKNPGIDLSSVNLADTVRNLVKTTCQVVPVAATISDIIVALALPAAIPLQQQASIIANQLCAQINVLKAARKAPRPSIANDGTPVIDYGSIIVNGKVVHVQVEAK